MEDSHSFFIMVPCSTCWNPCILPSNGMNPNSWTWTIGGIHENTDECWWILLGNNYPFIRYFVSLPTPRLIFCLRSLQIGIQWRKLPLRHKIKKRRDYGGFILPWKRFFEISILNILGIPCNLHCLLAHRIAYDKRRMSSCSWSSKQNNNWEFNR